jgi:hypothetical protein
MLPMPNARPEGPGVGVLRYSGLMSCEGENGDCAIALLPRVVLLLLPLPVCVKGERDGKDGMLRFGDEGRDCAGMTLALRARRRMRRSDRAYRPAGTVCIR